MKDFKEENIKIKKEIKSLPPHDEILISNGFRTSYLSLKENPGDLIKVPITALRIIFKIISDLRFSQYKLPSQLQYSLFDDEFKSENNSYGRFVFKTTDIIGEVKNKDSVKKALEFLTDYKKGWYVSVNSKGKKTETYGGLITSASALEGKISFLVSSYWMEKIVDLGENYNDSLYQIVFKLKSSKHVLFYLWLCALKKEGTAVNFKTLNTHFDLSYKDAKSLGKEFLKPIKILLDRYSSVSFNYSLKGDLISVINYNNINKENLLKEETFDKIKVKAKLLYWRRRHELSLEQSNSIKKTIDEQNPVFDVICNAYANFIANCKKMKLTPTDLKGSLFMVEFQKYIDKEVAGSEVMKQNQKTIKI